MLQINQFDRLTDELLIPVFSESRSLEVYTVCRRWQAVASDIDVLRNIAMGIGLESTSKDSRVLQGQIRHFCKKTVRTFAEIPNKPLEITTLLEEISSYKKFRNHFPAHYFDEYRDPSVSAEQEKENRESKKSIRHQKIFENLTLIHSWAQDRALVILLGEALGKDYSKILTSVPATRKMAKNFPLLFNSNREIFLNKKNIDLSNKFLTLLPKEIGLFTGIVELNIASNFLISLPSSISNLKKLESLNLSLNQFKTHPSFLKELPKLIELNVGSNGLYGLEEIKHYFENIR